MGRSFRDNVDITLQGQQVRHAKGQRKLAEQQRGLADQQLAELRTLNRNIAIISEQLAYMIERTQPSAEPRG